MESQQREQLRLSLTRFLDANPTRFGLSTALLWQMARNEGRLQLAREEVDAELQYLADKGYAIEVMKDLSPENRAWRITATGRDFYAQLAPE
ncbi:MAG TPA: hypothetical protein VHH73_12780 [Verrucomicrobiae bacterium]|nr:hypothetical protein [Verrucomicrobiae bacterium]